MQKIHYLSSILFLCLFCFACETDTSSTNSTSSNTNTSPEINNTEGTSVFTNNEDPNVLRINRPFEDKAGTSHQVTISDHSRAFTKELPSGTIISVPANAFVSMDGQPITTPVKLNFTSYNSPAEIIASGIPMKVVEDGEHAWMQTAGMFEIGGMTNGENVQIAPDKALDIAYASTETGDFDAWFFDEAKGNWINQGPTEIATNVNPNAAKEYKEVERLTQLTATAPVMPPGVDETNKLVFTDLNLDKAPNLKGKKEVILSYAGSDDKMAPSNNDWIKQPNIWHKKMLEPTAEKGIYQLTLLGNKSYQIPVRLALTEKEMANVKANFQRNLAKYNANKKLLADLTKNNIQQDHMRRQMQVKFMGIHNYDILVKLKESVPLMANFNFEGMPSKVTEMTTVYYITKKEKVVVGLKQRDWKKFRFDPKDDNKLIALLPNNKVAMFTQSDFKSAERQMVDAKDQEFVFNMTVTDETADSMDDLDGLIERARL